MKWSLGIMAAVTGIVVTIAGLGLLYRFPPEENPWYPRCLFHSVTGLNCPGCGSSRALHHLLHGRWAEALRCNALLVAGLAVASAGVLAKVVCPHPIADRTWRALTAKRWWPWLLLSLFLGFGIVRNLSTIPFRWLAP